MMRSVRVIILGLALGLGFSGMGLAAPPPGAPLEDLQYRLRLGVGGEVGRVHLRLTQVGPGRYRAEFSGAAKGAGKLLGRWLSERYATDMVLEGGRLKPLVYREEFQVQGRHITKEYRFDYSQGMVQVWRGEDRRELRKSWHAPLKEPVYDPLTLLYNLRLGAWGPLTGAQTLRVAAIPGPEPREMVINLGPESGPGRKVMVTVKSKAPGAESSEYFLVCTPRWVPLEAWYRVLAFAKLSGELLNPGGVMKDGLTAAPEPSAPQGANR